MYSSANNYTKKTDGGDWVVYNIFRDHLGTITELRNSEDGSVSEYSFDAWGRRRCANDWTNYDTSSEPPLFADRGFTGHEHMTEFIHINMLASRSFSEGWNGRLYDPVVGRFLNTDNFVQQPGNTQSYNRYSYCLNNPLKYTDPSGEQSQRDGDSWAMQMLGNSFVSFLNNWINTDMNFMEALANTSVSIDMNIGVGEGSFISNQGQDAYKTANHSSVLSNQIDRNWNDHINYGSYNPEGSFSLNYPFGGGIDYAGVANASFGLIGGVGEMLVGGAGEYFSVGIGTPVCVPLIIDGGIRVTSNTARLGAYFSRRDDLGSSIPGNGGAWIGKGIDLAFGKSFNEYGYGQALGGLTNDFVSFIGTGGTGNSMNNLVNNYNTSNAIWYLNSYVGYTTSTFNDIYPLVK